jgi:hypothetical protein
MNRAEPTAGEWNADDGGFVIADGIRIGEANWLGPAREREMLANASLFAASKDLLAACERVYAFHDDLCADSDISVQLRAAIAKAKGES